MKKELSVLALLAVISLGIGWALHVLRGEPPAATTSLPAETDLAAFRKVVTEKSALIFDARPAKFYTKAHVPGAVNLPKADFSKVGASHPALAGIPRDRPIVVYCSSVSCQDSGLVAEGLEALGYRQVSVFKEGMKGWLAAGYPAESAP